MDQKNTGKFVENNVCFENYKIITEINRKEIFAEEISDREKQEAVSVLLSGISCNEDVVKYKKCMRVNPEQDKMYPGYYIPPYSGNKKLRLIQGYLPKTHILYANHYELEILRLLFLFAPENKKVNEMVENTLYRLKNTCFGNSCTQGECMAAGISVLRFLAVVQSNDIEWIDKLVNPLGERFLSFENGQAAAQYGIPLSYLLMAFTDINSEKTRGLIVQKEEWLSGLLKKYQNTKKLPGGRSSERDSYHLMAKYILRNALSILSE